MYNHKKQYRCDIIRGKSKREMDNLLSVYALVIDAICPLPKKEFKDLFNNELQKYILKYDVTEKILNNHRTEIAGKLFGMYYEDNDSIIYESERTKKYLQDRDQPAFFKDICYKMQFPNGMQKFDTLQTRIDDKISVRPNAFILKFLLLARNENIKITMDELGYYILNSLDVLQGQATPNEVLKEIKIARQNNIQRYIENNGGTWG